jgi:uncharacterized protein
MTIVNDEIIRRLSEIEKQEEIQIFYACESGSRAWGFASPDSDFDIRFIYKRPLKDYLVLKDLPDTLEYPIQDNLDYSGWDFKKFLSHLYKSNGVMFEWLQSPIAYRDIHGFRNTFQKLMAEYFNPRSTINHYLGLTKRTILDFGESAEVKLKKYFYLLRPLMAAGWIHRKESIPPMDFESLQASADWDNRILSLVSELKQKKERSDESQLIPRITDLESFVTEKMQYYEANLPENPEYGKDISELNGLFFRGIMG